eukprot:superscaffoldBa00004247_g18532
MGCQPQTPLQAGVFLPCCRRLGSSCIRGGARDRCFTSTKLGDIATGTKGPHMLSCDVVQDSNPHVL